MRYMFSVAFSALALAAAPSFAQTSALKVTPKSPTSAKLLPGTRATVLSSIEGKAVNAVNAPMADTGVRLRDARYGRIVQTLATDKQGAFVFHEIDPGTYVVEVMAPGANTVVASSPLINVGTGEALSALVKMPFQTSALAGVLGGSSAASAITNAASAITAAAAASNIGAQTLTGAAATSTSTTNGR